MSFFGASDAAENEQIVVYNPLNALYSCIHDVSTRISPSNEGRQSIDGKPGHNYVIRWEKNQITVLYYVTFAKSISPNKKLLWKKVATMKTDDKGHACCVYSVENSTGAEKSIVEGYKFDISCRNIDNIEASTYEEVLRALVIPDL